MDIVTLLIKPASGRCNLRCSYCFYYDVMDKREVDAYPFMSDETLEVLVKRVFASKRKEVNFMFQGGEPTLVGVEFYKKLINLVEEYNSDAVIHYSIQTNGTLLDDSFVKFLKEHNFLVGISLDGPKEIHDSFRFNHQQKGTFDEVMRGIKLLQKYELDFNILTVVTDATAAKVKEVYTFLKGISEYIQFIPCIDTFDGVHTLTVDSFKTFLTELFDLWYEDVRQNNFIHVQYFEDLLAMIHRYAPTTCTLYGNCVRHQVVEANGNVYPCDFYVLDEWLIGNIHDHSLEELSVTQKAKEFVQNSYGIHEECKTCTFYSLCRGGCKRDKEPFEKVEETKTRYCEAYYGFFEHSIERLVEVARTMKS